MTHVPDDRFTAPNRISAGQAFRISMIWEIYSFALPASFMAAIFLYDAVRNDRVENEFSETSFARRFPRHKLTSSLPNVITLSQDVSVREEYAMDDKPGHEEKERAYKPYS